MNAQAASCPFVINTLSIHVCGASVQFQATEASSRPLKPVSERIGFAKSIRYMHCFFRLSVKITSIFFLKTNFEN